VFWVHVGLSVVLYQSTVEGGDLRQALAGNAAGSIE
jgi:hypothetical protein